MAALQSGQHINSVHACGSEISTGRPDVVAVASIITVNESMEVLIVYIGFNVQLLLNVQLWKCRASGCALDTIKLW